MIEPVDQQERTQLSTIEILEETFGELSEEILLAYQIAQEKEIQLEKTECELYVSPEQRRIYSEKHIEIYDPIADEIASRINDSLEQNKGISILIESGMFGGKSSLSILILNKLKEKYKTNSLIAIANCMQEDIVTARSLDIVENALKFGTKEQYERILEQMEKSGTKVLLLDEFSFLFGDDLKMLEKFHELCLSKGICVILTGLNKSYIGEPLEAFTHTNSSILKSQERIVCKAFVPGQGSEKPQGTHTTRYVKIGNRYILDLGILPLVVSKEERNLIEEPLAVYSATTTENTMLYILSSHPELLEILTKRKDLQNFQERNREILKNRS
jgi:thymidine kinase